MLDVEDDQTDEEEKEKDELNGNENHSSQLMSNQIEADIR